MTDEQPTQESYTCFWCEEQYVEDDMYETGYNHDPMCYECHEREHHKIWLKAQAEQQRRKDEAFYKGLES